MRSRPRTLSPATIVFLAGVSAALHVGKLPPAIPALRDALDITLVQAGFLLSLVQFAGMALGLAVGLATDGVGLKRSMVAGLVILSGASALGGWARDASSLLVLRGVEGFGFLLATLPAPSLIRLLVPPQRLSLMLGVWGTYMPLGSACALLLGPQFIASFGWQAWWWSLAAVSAGMALWMGWAVPPDGHRRAGAEPNAAPDVRAHGPDGGWRERLRHTLTSSGPWLVALSFATYSGQWLAVIGFLPSIYAQAGLSGAATGALTALAALINIVGSLTSGRLLHRGVRAHVLLQISFTTMALTALAAFGEVGGVGLPSTLRYAAVLMFSMVGGLIPGTLFSLAVRMAPTEYTVATTVGWMQQLSSLGQFVGPPLVAWLASRAGGWQWTWVATGACSVLGVLLAARIAGEPIRR
jgi:cyanate permease